MSANLIVDLGNTAQIQTTISAVNGVGSSPSSGAIIGQIVDMMHAHVFTNLLVQGGPSSGVFQVQVQTSDSTASGSFTDPTSGLAQIPAGFQSGGILIVNSGLWPSGSLPNGPNVNNAPLFCSGGAMAAGFQCPHRYARAVVRSGGSFAAPVSAMFVHQLQKIGSGTGFTFSPTSGTVRV